VRPLDSRRQPLRHWSAVCGKKENSWLRVEIGKWRKLMVCNNIEFYVDLLQQSRLSAEIATATVPLHDQIQLNLAYAT
jgi:hypothetical protein